MLLTTRSSRSSTFTPHTQTIFEAPLKKIAHLFVAMEKESEFLFRHSRQVRGENPTFDEPCFRNCSTLCLSCLSQRIMQNILSRIYHDLRNSGECALVVDQSNVLNVKLYRSPQEPDEVFDHQVPVLLEPRNKLSNMDWDIAVRHLVQFVDGVKSVSRLAVDAEVQIKIPHLPLMHDRLLKGFSPCLSPDGHCVLEAEPADIAVLRRGGDDRHFPVLERLRAD